MEKTTRTWYLSSMIWNRWLWWTKIFYLVNLIASHLFIFWGYGIVRSCHPSILSVKLCTALVGIKNMNCPELISILSDFWEFKILRVQPRGLQCCASLEGFSIINCKGLIQFNDDDLQELSLLRYPLYPVITSSVGAELESFSEREQIFYFWNSWMHNFYEKNWKSKD